MKRVLVTGAAGYLGGVFLEELAANGGAELIVAADVRAVPVERRLPGVEYISLDVRAPEAKDIFLALRIDTVVHLASIVTPGPASNREFEYSVDVLGTKNILECCAAADVGRIIVTSSGAAYGYHADSPAWLNEEHPLRGNEEFAYSRHKRLVEEMLSDWRKKRPQLEQVIFRIGTILGATTRNQITALFERKRILVMRGSPTPFVFIWDRDVARCLVQAVFSEKTGIFNLAGDGALGLRELAGLLGKPCLEVPAWFLKAALAVLKPLGLTRYGPEQVDFLRYRPVLDNARLKNDFGFRPARTSRETFELFAVGVKSHS